MSKVNILGTEYEIILRDPKENDPKLSDASGYCEPHSKKLVILDFKEDDHTVENSDDFKRKVIRHEIVHAFLHESGLRSCSWGDNEEIVDWIALQIVKMAKAMAEAGAM